MVKVRPHYAQVQIGEHLCEVKVMLYKCVRGWAPGGHHARGRIHIEHFTTERACMRAVTVAMSQGVFTCVPDTTA